MLPITNRTILQDSKILSVVQKWAAQIQSAGGDKEAETEASSTPSSRAATPLEVGGSK